MGVAEGVFFQFFRFSIEREKLIVIIDEQYSVLLLNYLDKCVCSSLLVQSHSLC
jgi:hypothetical protein